MMKDICVLVEHQRGKIADITFEMLGMGREVADALGYSLNAILLGNNVKGLVSQLGIADNVLLMEHEALSELIPETYLQALNKINDERDSEVVFVGYTNMSMGVGALLSSRLGIPFINYCKNLKVEGGKILATCVLYGGKVEAEVSSSQDKAIFVIYAGTYPADKGRADRSPTIKDISPPSFERKVVFKTYIEPEAGDVDITKQDILIAVGRGIQNKESIALAEELASELGGAVCASRPIIDQGWLPMTRQVGKSGMIVKPKLYLAAGISGAPEHQEGMRGSQFTVAINTDPHAPIFDISRYGIVGDALELLPLLTEAVRKKKGG
jgi:electron transfer flavoprotein alpha subunit